MNYLVDFKYAWHSTKRSPGVTLAIIAMLALGTGGVSAVFNPIYSTLFAPLPYPQPEQLVLIGGNIPIFNGYFNRFEQDELDRFFSNLTAYAPFPATSVTMPDTGKNQHVFAVDVSEDFFETLGVLPLRGSSFKHRSIRLGLVVSNRFWRNVLMEADDAIGKSIRVPVMGGAPIPIVGIMPESFNFPDGTDIWMYDGISGVLGSNARKYLGRLHPEMSMVLATKELMAMEFKPAPGLRGNDGPLLQSLQVVLYGDRRPLLVMLGSAAVFFLLLVCAGVINLLVTQGVRRQPEMTMRLIFGASRRNLVFQLLRETLPLVIVGAMAGLWLSEIVSAWLRAQFPALIGGEVVVPVKMVFFFALVLLVTIVGGLTPALYASGVDLNTYLKSGTNFKRRFIPLPFSLRELLVGIQLSLALALLTGVGLLVSSMMLHVDVPIRWSSRDMAVIRAEFPVEKWRASYESMTGNTLFFQEFQHRLSTMPEVANAGVFRPVPFSAEAERASQTSMGVFNAGRDDSERVSIPAIEGRASPEGFEMMGVTLIAGRLFSSVEMANEIDFQIRSWTERLAFVDRVVGVAIVNQSLAQQFWPGENAVGKMIYDGLNNSYEIVGVIRNFHQVGSNKNIDPVVYYPPDNWRPRQTFIVKLHSGAFLNDFRQRISSLDTGPMTIEMQSLGDVVSDAMSGTRMTLQLIGGFALLGIVVAGLGVYAVTSIMATSWDREMGIRVAMGAQTVDIIRLALWRGIRAILFGLPVGLFLAWIMTKILSSYLFQVKVGDPLVWVISCALLLIITIVAALIPAIRVSRVNPMDALRK